MNIASHLPDRARRELYEPHKEKQLKRKTLFLAITLAFAGNVSGAALARSGDLRADALLAIDMNRPAMIERVVATWQGGLSTEQEALVRTALAKMRADRLLAASLAPSLDGLLSVIQSEEQGSLAAKSITPKLAGDADLGYTPVAPCRLFDTRTPYGGTGPLLPDVLRNFDTSGSLTGQGGILGCNIPTGAQAIVMQTGALLPSAPRLHRGRCARRRRVPECGRALSTWPAIQHFGDIAAQYHERPVHAGRALQRNRGVR